jgi:hypothetical protein
MAQMRVKDQDLIIEQVVSKIETEQLELFNARKDVQAVEITIQSRIEGISKLVKQYQELAEDIKMETDALKEFVGAYQKKAGLSELNEYTYNGYQGFQLTNVSRYGSVNEVPDYKIMWKLDSSKKQELTTKLRLQTISGDFDVYKLIEELTAEFSS